MGNADRQKRRRELLEAEGVRPLNVLVPDDYRDQVRDLAARLREGEPWPDLETAERRAAKAEARAQKAEKRLERWEALSDPIRSVRQWFRRPWWKRLGAPPDVPRPPKGR